MAIPVISALVGGVVSSSLPKLYERVEKSVDLQDRVHCFDQELRQLDCAIKQHLRNPKDMSDRLKDHVTELRFLAYDIEDFIDCFEPSHGLRKMNKIIQRSVDLKERFKSLTKVEAKLTPQQGAPPATSQASTSSPASSEAGDDALLEQHLEGMKDRVEDVMDLVCWSETPSKKKKLKVISIVGSGGIGKTLLARQVCNGMKDVYTIRAFVQARGTDTEKVLEKIRNRLLREKELLKQQDEKGTSISFQGESSGKGKSKCIPDDTDGEGAFNGAEGGAQAPSTTCQPVDPPLHLCGHAREEQDARGRRRGYQPPGPSVDGASTSSQPLRPSCHEEKEYRYFIVIDDVPEEQLGKRIISAFKQDPQYNEVDLRIIMTTSILSVAEGCRSDHVYKMRPLNDADSEKLLLHLTGIENPTTPEKESLDEIKKICDGLPLALVSFAKFCGGTNNWEEAWRKLSHLEEDNDLANLQRVLDHSYTSLSSIQLQACLLYFCMFPHGHPVRKGSMIRRWLAEGPEVDCRTNAGGQPEDQKSSAKKSFESLVGRNVIWPNQESTNIEDVKTWKPPVVMLEYIKAMSGQLKFIMLSSPGGDKPNEIRRLSLHHTGNCDDGQVLSKNLSRLRTLAVFRKTNDEANLSFDKCKMLRLLDLEACNGLNDGHVDEICKRLRLLKYLSLGASINQVPRNIGDLKCLETLDLGKQTVVKVPAEVIMLPGLKHLLGKVELLTNYDPITSDSKSKKLKRFLSEESNLDTLAGFLTGESIGFPQLMGLLRNLKKVKIWCGPRVSPRNEDDLVESIREFLKRTLITDKVTFSLSIDFQEYTVPVLDKLVAGGASSKNRRWWSSFRKRRNHHGASPSEHSAHADGASSEQNRSLGGRLASLKLRRFAQLSTVPAFLSNLSSIEKLCLTSRVVNWKIILDGVSNLDTLKYLKVVEVNGRADGEDESVVVMQKDKLPRLQRMCLVANKKLPKFEVQDGALQSLISLHLICQDLSGFGEITHLTRLKEVALHSGVQPETKSDWKQAAKHHRNSPQVLLI